MVTFATYLSQNGRNGAAVLGLLKVGICFS